MAAIPENNIAYPVRIVFGDCSSGSGFFLNAYPFLVFGTAKHVICNEQDGSRYSDTVTITSFSGDLVHQNRMCLDLPKLEANGCVAAHDTHDVAIVKIGDYIEVDRWEPVAGVNVEVVEDTVSINAKEATTKYANVAIGNDVILFGYPSSIGMEEMPQLDYERPLLRKGIIAGKNESSKTLVIDCPVYWGNSGGPLMQTEGDRLRLVGVVSEYVPVAEKWLSLTHRYTNKTITNSGYSIAEPVDFVLELLDRI